MDLEHYTSRRGVAGILAAILIFGMLFTAGFAYLTWQAQSSNNGNAANLSRLNTIEQSNLEHIYLATIVAGTGPYTITIVAENSGGIATTIVGAYASAGGVLIKSPGIVTENSVLAIGASVSLTLTGIGVASGTISVITSRGNTFSAPFPNPPTATTETISTSTGSTTTTSTVPGLAGSNALVVQMVATPPVVFGCHNGCELVTVTVYNYALNPMKNVQLSPSPPKPTACGNTPGCTATLTPTTPACTGPYAPGGGSTTNTITAYSGSGPAPYIYYLCTYNVTTGNVGGYASFSGLATATEVFSATNQPTVASAESISNTIQIGGSANVLGQGPFSVNFFVFKYSSCYPIGPTGGGYHGGSYSYAAPCASTPAKIPPNQLRQLGNASLISGGSNYYVAFYFQITNDYNVILPILKYSFVQTESSLNLGEADLYIVGGPSNSSTIYPDYCQAGGGPPACASNHIPVFNAYTATAASCAETNGEPPASTCLNVSPGKSVVLTFAACGPGSSSWEWGGSQYANSWDPGSSGCATVNLGIGSQGSPTALILVLSYLLNNVVYTEDVAFQSVSFTP
jgi:hypothetical protein